MEKKKCKVCDVEDEQIPVFNIDFTATHICERCASAIFIQQAQWYSRSVGDKVAIRRVMPSLLEFKNRRESLNMTMGDVERKLGLSKATVSRIEKGNNPSYETVMQLNSFYESYGV